MQLQTQRLILIPCSEEFLSTLSEDAYEVGPHIHSHLENLRKDPSLLGWGVWLVLQKETNKVIGDIGFKGKPTKENTVEVGYGILPSAQNKGYATESVNEIIQWAFSTNKVNKVIAECLKDNLPSIKVLEKLNMNRVAEDDTMIKWEITL